MSDSETDKEYMSVDQALVQGDSGTRLNKIEQLACSLFVVLFFVIANLISLSHYPQYKDLLLKRLEPVAALSALGQNWTMFAPEPRSINFHSTAMIEFEDRSIRMVEFPRMEYFDNLTKFRRYKLRKLFNDYMVNPIGEKYRPAIAKYILLSVFDQDNPPTKVSFDFNFRKLEPVKADGSNFEKRDAVRLHTGKSTIFVYRVRTNDLKWLRAASTR